MASVKITTFWPFFTLVISYSLTVVETCKSVQSLISNISPPLYESPDSTPTAVTVPLIGAVTAQAANVSLASVTDFCASLSVFLLFVLAFVTASFAESIFDWFCLFVFSLSETACSYVVFALSKVSFAFCFSSTDFAFLYSFFACSYALFADATVLFDFLFCVEYVLFASESFLCAEDNSDAACVLASDKLSSASVKASCKSDSSKVTNVCPFFTVSPSDTFTLFTFTLVTSAETVFAFALSIVPVALTELVKSILERLTVVSFAVCIPFSFFPKNFGIRIAAVIKSTIIIINNIVSFLCFFIPRPIFPKNFFKLLSSWLIVFFTFSTFNLKKKYGQPVFILW